MSAQKAPDSVPLLWHSMDLRVPLPPLETYAAGVELIRAGEGASYVYCVAKGAVKVSRLNSEGEDAIVDLAFPGDLIGAHSVLLGEDWDETATTLVASVLGRWRAGEFLTRFSTQPAFAAETGRLLSRQLQRQRRLAAEFGRRNARWKLQMLVRSWPADSEARAGKPAKDFALPLSRTELGQLLGISRFQVSRLLGELEQEGLIRRRSRQIRVHLTTSGRAPI